MPTEILEYINKAAECESKGMYAEQLEQLKEAVRIRPDSAVAHNNLGAALANLGRYDEAEKEFRQAVERHTSDSQPEEMSDQQCSTNTHSPHPKGRKEKCAAKGKWGRATCQTRLAAEARAVMPRHVREASVRRNW